MNVEKYTRAARRGLSVLLICCLMAVLLVTTAPPVSADGPVVTRNLPDTVLAGEEFEVTVQFTASADGFTAAANDYAPVGWEVSANTAWCTPSGGIVNVPSINQFQIIWTGPDAAKNLGTQFNLKYKVTVPGGTPAGVYAFTGGQVGYSILGSPVTYVDITGDSEVEILPSYTLTLSSSAGGEVDKPGEGVFSYLAGTEVSLKAVADNGYDFYEWMGGVCTVDDVSDATTTVLMDDNYEISANFTPEPPYLVVDKEADPGTIGQEGSGLTPEDSTITLTVTGAGVASEINKLDVVFSLDASGSMGSGAGSSMECAKDGAKAFIDNMNPARDQAGAVSWASSVLNSWPLTDDFDAMKANIDTIFAGGGTNLEVGLAEAVAVMDAGKQTGSARCIIFLSDGSGTYTGTATADAASKGYVIYSIGVGGGVYEPDLQHMADQTGGSYHNALTAEDIEDVFEEIAGEISGVAGTNVMVTDVLQKYIVLLDDSFSIEPDNITYNADGTTTLEWYLGVVAIDEEWTVSFDVRSERCGRVLANVVDDSMVTYEPVINLGGGFSSTEHTEEVLFPETYLNVRCTDEEEYCAEVPEGPAEMSIQSIYADPEQVVQNQEVEVWVSVGNSGETKGTKSVALYVNGVLEQSQTIGVGPGGGQNVLFLVSRAIPGTYTVSVEGREAQFTVLGMGPPQAAPAPPQASAGFGGGLGTGGIIAIIVVVVALVVGLLVILRREPA